jgi:hypothetical protein
MAQASLPAPAPVTFADGQCCSDPPGNPRVSRAATHDASLAEPLVGGGHRDQATAAGLPRHRSRGGMCSPFITNESASRIAVEAGDDAGLEQQPNGQWR